MYPLHFVFMTTILLAPVAMNAGSKPAKTIVVDASNLPHDPKPGDKPITLSSDLLQRLLPELDKPRLMSFENLGMKEIQNFLEEGYVFVLRGDFNRDGYADIAFVGKYDNNRVPDENAYLAIITIKKRQIIRLVFQKLATSKVFLLYSWNYKPKVDAIQLIFPQFQDECGFFFWANKKWQYEVCEY